MSTYGDAWKALVSIVVAEKKKYSKVLELTGETYILLAEKRMPPQKFLPCFLSLSSRPVNRRYTFGGVWGWGEKDEYNSISSI